MAVVTFNLDVYPYCKGDTVKLSDEEKKRVDEAVKARNLQDAYTAAETKKADTKTKAKK
jgi:hypothetical protein